MKERRYVLFTAIVGISVIHLEPITAENDPCPSTATKMIPLNLAWIRKPPYTINMTNDSCRENIICREIISCVNGQNASLTLHQAASQSEMMKLMKLNKTQIAFPVFMPPYKEEESEFEFIPFLEHSEWFEMEYIIKEIDALRIVVGEVAKSWLWLVTILVLSAIAGIKMWTLETCRRSEEFPRPFLKGSWDGFWWSFISLTTVGYGDKAPKSAIGRVFSVVWILCGVIFIAIFTAYVTSSLTAASLKKDMIRLNGLNVAVLDKAIEYQVVVKEKSKPKVFDQIDDAIKAVKSDEVDGMLLDYYTADYYRQMDKFKSLFTASKFFEDVQVGFLLSKNITNRTSRCGLGDIEEYLDLEYWFEEVAIDYDYDPEPSFSLFEVSAPFVRKFLYLSLGILGLMIIIGIVWETCKRRSTDAKEKMELVSVCVEKLDVAKGIEREAMRGNIDETKKLLQEVQEQLVKLESSVLQVFEKLETEELEGKKQINDKRS